MNKQIKVMIAYDGSGYADAAIDDLRRAGLPPDSEVLIVSVVDSAESCPWVSALDLLSQFTEWKIDWEVLEGKPADELLRKASEWKPDLIVAGSHGRSAIGRFFLGSVSKKIAEEAACAVRVVRHGFGKTGDEPVKIIIGARGLPDAERVIESVGRRVWADGTKAHLVAVDDGVSAGRVSAVYPDAKAIFEQAAERLADSGLQISIDVESGDAKSVLLAAAESWNADSIFVAASWAGGEPCVDETAAGLITGAKCTIEIVR